MRFRSSSVKRGDLRTGPTPPRNARGSFLRRWCLWLRHARGCPMPGWVRWTWERKPHEGVRWECACGRRYEREAETITGER